MRFNRKARTKDGQDLIPFLIEGSTVYCFNNARKTVIKKMSDFEDLSISESTKKEVVVSPVLENTDQLFTEKAEEEPRKKSGKKIVVVKPEIEKIDDLLDEPVMEPIVEVVPPKPEKLPDSLNLDDGYI